MNNITITIAAPELVAAINKLAEAMVKGNATPTTASAAPATVPTGKPAPPATDKPQPAPTKEPAYTLDQLAVAATPIADAGRQEELRQLLATLGVQALTQLQPEQYGAFATGLRALGAKI
jgi:hypothetical protein